MSDMKRLGAMLVATAAGFGLTAWGAEQDHAKINITGELAIDAVSRKNTTTFNSAESWTNPGVNVTNFANTKQNDASDLIQTKVYLNFGVDLNTNSRVFIQMGGKNTAGNNTGVAANPNTGMAYGTPGGDSSFNARIRQAYLEMNEVLVSGMGIRFGIQDMVKGIDRGDANHFVMYSPGWGKHFQIRNAGRVERSYSTRGRTQNLPANNALGFDDLNTTDGGTFAWVVTYDVKDIGSAELFYVKLEEAGNDYANDSYIWGVDGRMPLKNVSEGSVATAHLFNVRDDSILQQEVAVTDRPGSGTDFWQFGLGTDLFFGDRQIEFYGEVAFQQGAFTNGYNTTTPGWDQGMEKRQKAYAYYLGGKYQIPGAADFKPALDVSYWSFSGDDNQHDENNTGFVNYGDNKSSMVVEENEYGIGLNNNYNVWRFKGSVDLDGVLKKGRKTPLALSYHSFNVNEEDIDSAYGPTTGTGAGAGLGGGKTLKPSHLGDEFDITLSHDYSENVTFKLGAGWFFPGSYVRENANLGVWQVASAGGSTVPALGTPGLSHGDGSPAKVMTFTTSVKF